MKKLAILVILLMVIVTACGTEKPQPEAADNNDIPATPQQPDENEKEVPPQQGNINNDVNIENQGESDGAGVDGDSGENVNDTDVRVAAQIAGFFYDLQHIQKYYDDSIKAISTVSLGTTTLAWNGGTASLDSFLVRPVFPLNNGSVSIGAMVRQPSGDIFFNLPMQGSGHSIPPEYLDALPPDGAMAALPGACPAAAKPDVTFETADGEDVTPALLLEKNLQSIPTDMVTIDQNDHGSLFSIINSIVPLRDPSLATPQGWNNLLWNELKDMQAPAESLMDYQMWNIAGDIEQQINEMYAEHMESIGVPQMVIDAFNGSDKTGWYASDPPTEEDARARMDIIAEMTGSVRGTVHEQRDFSITGAGQAPVFGQQTGDGTVTCNHPEQGDMNFEIDILLDRFDDDGRAIGGTVSAIDAENGYTVEIVFQPDGSKKGQVFRDGELVGELTMETNAEKFENYVDVQVNQSVPLPEAYQQ